jgi:uncharacterized damage-inducible protein DinB
VDDEKLRYPVGRFQPPDAITGSLRDEALAHLEVAPARLREAVRGLDDAQLDTPYREGGWTVRQVVHHLADSHVNGYLRTKWTLTEDRPPIRGYDRGAFSDQPDARSGPVEASLSLLDGLHGRWALLLRSLGAEELDRRFVHPDGGEPSVDSLIQLYAWHGRHHTAHILALRDRMAW